MPNFDGLIGALLLQLVCAGDTVAFLTTLVGVAFGGGRRGLWIGLAVGFGVALAMCLFVAYGLFVEPSGVMKTYGLSRTPGADLNMVLLLALVHGVGLIVGAGSGYGFTRLSKARPDPYPDLDDSNVG